MSKVNGEQTGGRQMGEGEGLGEGGEGIRTYRSAVTKLSPGYNAQHREDRQ